jgi:hypothetical protein
MAGPYKDVSDLLDPQNVKHLLTRSVIVIISKLVELYSGVYLYRLFWSFLLITG